MVSKRVSICVHSAASDIYLEYSSFLINAPNYALLTNFPWSVWNLNRKNWIHYRNNWSALDAHLWWLEKFSINHNLINNFVTHIAVDLKLFESQVAANSGTICLMHGVFVQKWQVIKLSLECASKFSPKM